MPLLKGILYRNLFVYNLLDVIKLGFKYNLRFQIAAEYITRGNSVIDICSGAGYLRNFLPQGCSYMCIDASPEFSGRLIKRGIPCQIIDLNKAKGVDFSEYNADVLVMIISLSQFKNTSMHNLLELFKQMARKVIIVEDALKKPRSKDSLLQRSVNYLASRNYFNPIEMFTFDEFRGVMKQHSYNISKQQGRYIVGIYNG